MAGGVVLENLSWKKLGALCLVLLLAQVVAFLIGGLIAPNPSTAQVFITTKCIDNGVNALGEDKFYQPYTDSNQNCDQVSNFDEATKKKITANQIVFAILMPHRPNGMSRWFQYFMALLKLKIKIDSSFEFNKDALVTLDIRMAYKDTNKEEEDWKMFHKSTEIRQFFNCPGIPDTQNGDEISCDLFPLFELGNVYHPLYLINIRLPIVEDEDIPDNEKTNEDIGSVQDLEIVGIHQNGGFTKVWVTMKTALTPVILIALVWFWQRVTKVNRKSFLLERMILALGITTFILDFPLEWLTLWVNFSPMLLLTDIRQGLFYATLFCFWVTFAGEHILDQVQRNRLSAYYFQYGCIIFGAVCLLVFDLCERGIQLTNPFYSIWATRTGANLAQAFVIVALVCAGLYFLFLAYMIVRVFLNIRNKSAAIRHMAPARRQYYQGLIYRFKFFLFYTFVCAALTIAAFMILQIYEGHWEGNPDIHVNSAFFTGVYGMWNIYVFSVLVLYAPSFKKYSPQKNGDASGSSQEEYAFQSMSGQDSGSHGLGSAGEAVSELMNVAGKAAQE